MRFVALVPGCRIVDERGKREAGRCGPHGIVPNLRCPRNGCSNRVSQRLHRGRPRRRDTGCRGALHPWRDRARRVQVLHTRHGRIDPALLLGLGTCGGARHRPAQDPSQRGMPVLSAACNRQPADRVGQVYIYRHQTVRSLAVDALERSLFILWSAYCLVFWPSFYNKGSITNENSNSCICSGRGSGRPSPCQSDTERRFRGRQHGFHLGVQVFSWQCGNQGLYTVGSNPKAWHSLFADAGDHTSGAGLMFIANGSSDIGDIVWASLDTTSIVNPNQVPEPVTSALFGLGLLGLLAARRRTADGGLTALHSTGQSRTANGGPPGVGRHLPPCRNRSPAGSRCRAPAPCRPAGAPPARSRRGTGKGSSVPSMP